MLTEAYVKFSTTPYTYNYDEGIGVAITIRNNKTHVKTTGFHRGELSNNDIEEMIRNAALGLPYSLYINDRRYSLHRSYLYVKLHDVLDNVDIFLINNEYIRMSKTTHIKKRGKGEIGSVDYVLREAVLYPNLKQRRIMEKIVEDVLLERKFTDEHEALLLSDYIVRTIKKCVSHAPDELVVDGAYIFDEKLKRLVEEEGAMLVREILENGIPVYLDVLDIMYSAVVILF